MCAIYQERLKSHLPLLSHITYLLFSLQLQYFHSFQAHVQTKKEKNPQGNYKQKEIKFKRQSGTNLYEISFISQHTYEESKTTSVHKIKILQHKTLLQLAI